MADINIVRAPDAPTRADGASIPTAGLLRPFEDGRPPVAPTPEEQGAIEHALLTPLRSPFRRGEQSVDLAPTRSAQDIGAEQGSVSQPGDVIVDPVTQNPIPMGLL